MSDQNESHIGYLHALRIVALPMASIGGIASVVLWFAADAWIRTIVEEEIDQHVVMAAEASLKVREHDGKLAQHEEEIETNEQRINSQDQRFTDFVRELLERL